MPNNTQIVIVKANLDHLSSLKKISDKNRKQLGFIPRAKFQEAINSGRVYVALANDEVVGFVNFRHRKTDLQTTLSEICVVTDLREQGIGKQLLRALQIECEALSRSWIQLKVSG